jgi:hypothetical protein
LLAGSFCLPTLSDNPTASLARQTESFQQTGSAILIHLGQSINISNPNEDAMYLKLSIGGAGGPDYLVPSGGNKVMTVPVDSSLVGKTLHISGTLNGIIVVVYVCKIVA